MTEVRNSETGRRHAQQELRGKALRQKESGLGEPSIQQNKEAFFDQITPLRKPLQSYTKRRLRIAYLNLQIRTPFTADTDGEVWFPEELDDSEYQPPDFNPPVSRNDPEEQLNRKKR